MEALATEVSKEQREASITFGGLVHRAAVRGGGKSEIGRRVNADKGFVTVITTGHAYSQDRVMLEALVAAIRPGELPKADLARLKDLIPTIKGDS